MDLSEPLVLYNSGLVGAGRCTWIVPKKMICLAIAYFWTKIHELAFISSGHLLAYSLIVVFVSSRSMGQNTLGSPRVIHHDEAPLWYGLQKTKCF